VQALLKILLREIHPEKQNERIILQSNPKGSPKRNLAVDPHYIVE
jgi:hypothetical protein